MVAQSVLLHGTHGTALHEATSSTAKSAGTMGEFASMDSMDLIHVWSWYWDILMQRLHTLKLTNLVYLPLVPWYIMICHDMSWYIMICHDMSWYVMICHDMSWLASEFHGFSTLSKAWFGDVGGRNAPVESLPHVRTCASLTPQSNKSHFMTFHIEFCFNLDFNIINIQMLMFQAWDCLSLSQNRRCGFFFNDVLIFLVALW
jgi:hypothetical protein